MTLGAFLSVAILHLMAAISPGPAVLMAARTGVTEGLRTGALLIVVFLNKTLWNTFVARIFSLHATRARHVSLKTLIDRAFGGLQAALGVKIALT